MDTSHIFWAIEIQFFMSSHDLHYIFPPHPLVQKTLSMYIANKIAKDQYVQPNVPTTTILTVKKNNFNHDTGPHVYDTPDNNNKLVLCILLQDGTFIEVSAFLKWIFNFQQTNKKNMCLLAYLDRRPQAVDDTRRVASVVRPACLATEV